MVRAPSIRRVHRFTTMLVMVIVGVLLAQAQPQPLLQPVFPIPGQDAVDVTSSVVVQAPAAIDPTTVTTYFPNAAPNGWRPPVPTVLVLREDLARAHPRDAWQRYAIVGGTSIENQRTVRWKPARLLPRTTYRCIISGIALDPRQGGALCPTLEFSFTTARPVPTVRATSLDTHHVVTCRQPIAIVWNDPIPNPAIAQSIIDMEAYGTDGRWNKLPIALTVAPDLTSAVVYPRDAWPIGQPIRLRCALEQLTGDLRTNYVRQTVVRGATTVSTTVASLPNHPIPSDVVEAFDTTTVVVRAGTDREFVAPHTLPYPWRFVRWHAPDVPSLDGQTEHRVRMLVDCANAKAKLAVTALIERIDSTDLDIDVDSGGRVDVYTTTGDLLASVTQSATLRVAVAQAPITLAAVAAANMSFSAWQQAPQGSVGSPAAALVIPPATLVGMNGSGQHHGNTAVGPGVNPRFVPLSPYRTERYRLVARIADDDPDPLFRIDDAVSFTTAREFEDIVPGTRTVCVTAQRCWEITGYHDPSVGPPVRFATPVQQYCLTAAMLDPENAITLFARRKRIDMRVERVVLGSEDPSHVLPDQQTHPETRVDVDKRVVVQGVERWMPLGKISCVTPRDVFERYELRCGDQIRLRVTAASHRGDEWRWWSVRNRYAMPVTKQQSMKGGEFTLVLDQDIAGYDGQACDERPTGYPEVRVQAAFRRVFAVASMSMRIRTLQGSDRSRYRFEERWFDPLTYYERQADEPRGGRHVEYVPRKGTIVKVKYTLPFDGPSILAGGMSASSWDNYLITNPHATDLDFSVATGDRGNTNFLPTTGQSPDIVEFFICDPLTRPVKQALHFGIVDITCGAGVRSIYQEPLVAPYTFTVQQMELPGFGLRLQRADIAYDGDWDFWPFVLKGEIYNSIYGGNLAIDGAHHTSTAFTRLPVCTEQQGKSGECTIAYSDDDKTLGYGDRAMWLQTMWMDGLDKAWWMMTTWDEDCKDDDDCLVNKMDDVINIVKRGVDAYAGTGGSGDLDWDSSLPELIKAGADLIALLLPPDEQDEFLGEGTFLEDVGTYWGMRTAIAPRIPVHHENITYHLRGQWYVSKAVLR